ncbi:MAG: hypothetical protein ACXVID_03280, partial [Thermoanaerobaculia bacterium]
MKKALPRQKPLLRMNLESLDGRSQSETGARRRFSLKEPRTPLSSGRRQEKHYRLRFSLEKREGRNYLERQPQTPVAERRGAQKERAKRSRYLAEGGFVFKRKEDGKREVFSKMSTSNGRESATGTRAEKVAAGARISGLTFRRLFTDGVTHPFDS